MHLSPAASCPSPLPPALRQPHLDPLSALSHVKGLHLNMAFVLNPGTLTFLLGRHFPRLFGYTQRDVELLSPFKEKVFYSLMRESGYMHIQCTKPDTVGECGAGSQASRSAWRGPGASPTPPHCSGMKTSQEGPELFVMLQFWAQVRRCMAGTSQTPA